MELGNSRAWLSDHQIIFPWHFISTTCGSPIVKFLYLLCWSSPVIVYYFRWCASLVLLRHTQSLRQKYTSWQRMKVVGTQLSCRITVHSSTSGLLMSLEKSSCLVTWRWFCPVTMWLQISSWYRLFLLNKVGTMLALHLICPGYSWDLHENKRTNMMSVFYVTQGKDLRWGKEGELLVLELSPKLLANQFPLCFQ